MVARKHVRQRSEDIPIFTNLASVSSKELSKEIAKEGDEIDQENGNSNSSKIKVHPLLRMTTTEQDQANCFDKDGGEQQQQERQKLQQQQVIIYRINSASSVSQQSWNNNNSIVWYSFLSDYLRWTFRASPMMVFWTAYATFLIVVLTFALLILWAGQRQPYCITVAGNDFVDTQQQRPSGARFMDALQLSWTTFSTVGYGMVASLATPVTDSKDVKHHYNCLGINVLMALESFVGVLFSAIMGSIILGKFARMLATAHVQFSDPICIRYGSALTCHPMESINKGQQKQLEDMNNAEEGLVKNTSFASSTSTSTSNHHHHHLSHPNLRRLKSGTHARSPSLMDAPCPILEFRIVNILSEQSGAEIINATVRVVAMTLGTHVHKTEQEYYSSKHNYNKNNTSNNNNNKSFRNNKLNHNNHSRVTTPFAMPGKNNGKAFLGASQSISGGAANGSLFQKVHHHLTQAAAVVEVPGGDSTDVLPYKDGEEGERDEEQGTGPYFLTPSPLPPIREGSLQKIQEHLEETENDDDTATSTEWTAVSNNNNNNNNCDFLQSVQTQATEEPVSDGGSFRWMKNSNSNSEQRPIQLRGSSFKMSLPSLPVVPKLQLRRKTNSAGVGKMASLPSTFPSSNASSTIRVEEGGPSELAPPRIYHKLEVQTDRHPFFRRIWYIRHRLNEQSPLLSDEARRMITENGGDWPNKLNDPAEIRRHLQVNEIIVTFSGTANVSGRNVFAVKVYDYADITIGYTFANALKPSSQTQTPGLVVADLELINDVREQKGGGAEPFVNAIMSDETKAAIQAATKMR